MVRLVGFFVGLLSVYLFSLFNPQNDNVVLFPVCVEDSAPPVETFGVKVGDFGLDYCIPKEKRSPNTLEEG